MIRPAHGVGCDPGAQRPHFLAQMVQFAQDVSPHRTVVLLHFRFDEDGRQRRGHQLGSTAPLNSVFTNCRTASE